MSYEYGSTLFRTCAEMLAAIAYDWASAGNGREWLRESFAQMSDEQLARDCIEGWGLDQKGEREYAFDDEEHPSHMARYGYDVTDLADAFADLREETAKEEDAA